MEEYYLHNFEVEEEFEGGLQFHILSGGGSETKLQTKPVTTHPHIRRNFEEVWIFHTHNNTDKNGLATLTKKIPDTITSWVVTGFSLNDKTGFGMVTNPTNIEVFQPFFVSTNLPYSVKRGEVLSIPVIIFNYMDKALDAEVTMENTDDEYDFTEVSNEIEELVLEDKQRVKMVTVPSNSGKSLSFMIRPNKVGEITLKIKAITALAGDAMHQKLKVEPEGVTQYENQAIFITPSKEPIKETLEAAIPKEAVLDSEYLEFSVVGDILGPTIKNIDKLVRKPYGCGEQNMVNFVPNILVLHYLDAIKRDMPTVVQKAKNYMEVGYQRELTYKHKNGAYSAFGEGSSEPNSWLTAYVARSFIQAKKYITIDSDVIDQALQYVVSNQLENGQFKQTGRLFHPAHQNDVGFTAFALLALLEDMDYSNKYKSEIEKGIKYLDDNIEKESDTYALALAVVVLKKVQHPSANKLMEKLEKLAHEENGLKWWTKSSKDHNNDIEITAYILEAYVYTEPAGKLLPIIKWLIGNRNSNGGFDSTQDTVVGLQALIKFAEKYIAGADGKMTISFEALDGEGKETTKGTFSVDKENSLILQTHVLPKSSRQIKFEANGEGSSLVQLSYSYNLATKDDKPSFSIKHTIQPTDYPNLLQIDVCADFVPGANSDIKESNMAIMEIYLPSGFTADTDKFNAIRQVKQVQRIETKNSETAIIVYFDFLTAGEEVCFKVNAEKTHAVAKQKPAAITMYDYYNSDQRATVYYEVKSSFFYSIVAPGTIQSKHNYSVSVTLHKNTEPATIKLAIKGPSYNEEKTIDILPSQTEVINFVIPKLKTGKYQLESEGIKGLIFKNSTELNFKIKEPKIYIQTDKAVYKPGDLVQYRIIVLNENIRPAKLEHALRLSIIDGAGNLVKQVNDIILTKGVYAGQFQLSEQPVMGEWLMEVIQGPNEDDTKTEKKFEVAKYVLPKFTVDIETNKNNAIKDNLKITIRSKYTYGKPVKGQATVTLDAYNGRTEKTIDVDGKGYVEFESKEYLDLALPQLNNRYGYYYRIPPINILAVMTEEHTGNKQNKTIAVNLHLSRYNIEVPKNMREFVVNKPFELKAIVKNLDGSPVQNEKSVAKLLISKKGLYYSDITMPVTADYEIISELDKSGSAMFNVTIPAVGYYYNVKIIYADQTKYLPTLVVKEKESEVFKKKDVEEDVGSLKLVNKNEKFQLDQDIIVEVKSNKHIPYYVYAIVARGNIIKNEHVQVPENAKTHAIKIKPLFEMVPESHLYVYFVLDGELKFEEMTLNFPKEFQNKASFNAIEITAPEHAKPSEEVTLNIKTDPDSFVALLGVDQSVLLLKSGNDLDSKQIIDDLNTYKTSTPEIRGVGRYPGRTSSLITQTNANYPYSTAFYISDSSKFPSVEDYTDNLFVSDIVTSETETVSNLKIRKDFPDTWIFDNINSTDKNGLASLTKKIPDTITSWVVTGFSLNDKTGFSMVTNPTNIEVFQPFFVSTNLPYAIKRGEIISVPIIVFNYMDKALDAEVTMENTDNEYDFTEVSNEIEELVLKDKKRVKMVTVPSNSGKSLSFMVRPNKAGEITLKIKAITPLAGDVIHQKLKVEPEGVTQYENQAIFITPAKEPIKETLKAAIPNEVVLDSEYLEFSVIGDILGPTIKNIELLVRKPYGCGEQNMVNFVPNILILHYLDATKRYMPSVVEKAKNFMEIGYQRELTYKHKNGAYSAFGEGNCEPSSWLTAYVARSFIQAKKYIAIDSDVIDKALEYVVANQLENGQFEQTGRLIHATHQNDVGYTAFALLALLEDLDYSNKYKSEIEKGIKYLVDNIDKENDTYALAPTLLVLKKVQHPSADKLMEKLEKLSHYNNGRKWWIKSAKNRDNDIEITAYILEAYVYSEPPGKILPIVKWLVGNRNNLGGFDSTLDTNVGLQALIRFAEKYVAGGDGKMTINFKAQDAEGKETSKGSFSVDKENSLILQTYVLPKSSRQVVFEADGKGSSLVQLSYRYNLATKDDKPSFNIKHEIQPTDYLNLLQMEVCADFNAGSESVIKESNMAIMEIYLPSGFTADTDKFNEIHQIKHVQRVETKMDDTAIIVYFDYLTAGEEVCFKVNAEKSHAVAKQKPAAIIMYDYYNADQRSTVYYEVKSSLCDICEEGECGKVCEIKAGK
ncbi:CD109 antigen [Lucilia cuprina]|nr:CD109 antigen [Lucilia cuprina]